MVQPLIPRSEVFSNSWAAAKKFFTEDMKESIGFLFIALASFALSIGRVYLPAGLHVAIGIFDIIALQAIGSSFVGMRLTSSILAERQNKPSKRFQIGVFLSFLLISILSGLAVAGGALALIIPGIWMSVAFAFSTYTLLDEGRRGRQALARSAQLVKGRWWSVVDRLILPGLLVLVVSILTSSIIESIIGLIAGYRPSNLVDQAPSAGLAGFSLFTPAASQVAYGALQVINAIPLIFLAPFMIHVMTTIYLDLKRTEK